MKTLSTIKSIAARAAFSGAAVLFALYSLPASAHVTLEYEVANAGSYYKGTFKVGHGCNGSPTRQVIVSIPQGVQGARPMPKAGWTLQLTRDSMVKPLAENGKAAADEVSRISWTANSPKEHLQNDWYDEFVVQAKLPAGEGTLYWPISQVCEEGRVDWTEIPKPGQKLHDLKRPAAALELIPAGGGGHQH